jgi:hypothetical protein
MFEPVLFRLFLFEDGLDSVRQRGGVGHVQVTGYPDDSCVAVEETLKDIFLFYENRQKVNRSQWNNTYDTNAGKQLS